MANSVSGCHVVSHNLTNLLASTNKFISAIMPNKPQNPRTAPKILFKNSIQFGTKWLVEKNLNNSYAYVWLLHSFISRFPD
jgi:hypothetical protein